MKHKIFIIEILSNTKRSDSFITLDIVVALAKTLNSEGVEVVNIYSIP